MRQIIWRKPKPHKPAKLRHKAVIWGIVLLNGIAMSAMQEERSNKKS